MGLYKPDSRESEAGDRNCRLQRFGNALSVWLFQWYNLQSEFQNQDLSEFNAKAQRRKVAKGGENGEWRRDNRPLQPNVNAP